MDRKLTISDLPIECIGEILKNIRDHDHRINVRFVCSLWCTLVDQNCSSEHYRIDLERMKRLPHKPGTKTAQRVKKRNKIAHFSEDFFSLFVNSQRKKINFHFESVDFRSSEKFWRIKGADIVSLDLAAACRNIQVALIEIIKHCVCLRELTIEFSPYNDSEEQERQLKDSFENCVADGRTNSSVRFLNLKNQQLNNVNNTAQLIGGIFIGLRNVFFEGLKNVNDWSTSLESLSVSFQNLKFQIKLFDGCNTFTFDPPGQVPESERIKCLSLGGIYANEDISSHLSRYPCNHNNLNTLYINSSGSYYRLDKVDDLIAKCPSLKSLYISFMFSNAVPPTNSLRKNIIESITFKECSNDISRPCPINDAFLQSFKNLRTFKCHNLEYSDFVILTSNLQYLEVLKINYGFVDMNSEPTISNDSLTELRMPRSFLFNTTTKYAFRNLRNLHLCEYFSTEPKLSDIYDHLKRVNCAKLKILQLDFRVRYCCIEQDEYTEWLIKILSLFPTLIEFTSYISGINVDERVNRMRTFDGTLRTILKNHPRLRKIGSSFRPHSLNMISPSHIKHRCKMGDSVLYIG